METFPNVNFLKYSEKLYAPTIFFVIVASFDTNRNALNEAINNLF